MWEPSLPVHCHAEQCRRRTHLHSTHTSGSTLPDHVLFHWQGTRDKRVKRSWRMWTRMGRDFTSTQASNQSGLALENVPLCLRRQMQPEVQRHLLWLGVDQTNHWKKKRNEQSHFDWSNKTKQTNFWLFCSLCDSKFALMCSVFPNNTWVWHPGVMKVISWEVRKEKKKVAPESMT